MHSKNLFDSVHLERRFGPDCAITMIIEQKRKTGKKLEGHFDGKSLQTEHIFVMEWDMIIPTNAYFIKML